MSSQILANANQSNLNLTEYKVLIAWITDSDSYSACPRVISERTNIAIKNVRRAFNGLVEKGILYKSDSKMVNTTGGNQIMIIYSATKGASETEKGASPQRPKGASPQRPISTNKPTNTILTKTVEKQASPVKKVREEIVNPQEGEFSIDLSWVDDEFQQCFS
jgi:hypothetical protein